MTLWDYDKVRPVAPFTKDVFTTYDPFEYVDLPPGVDWNSTHPLARKNRLALAHSSNLAEGVAPDAAVVLLEGKLLAANVPDQEFMDKTNAVSKRRTAVVLTYIAELKAAGYCRREITQIVTAYRDQPQIDRPLSDFLPATKVAAE
jgi:hypothetical protein